jgi:hypothetical protein
MGLIGATIVFVLFGVGFLFSPDPDAALLAVGFGTVIAAIIVVPCVPGILAGYGLIKRYNWARTLALILAFLNLPGLPFGTALGIYGIWVLFNDETARVFTNQPQQPDSHPAT